MSIIERIDSSLVAVRSRHQFRGYPLTVSLGNKEWDELVYAAAPSVIAVNLSRRPSNEPPTVFGYPISRVDVDSYFKVCAEVS